MYFIRNAFRATDMEYMYVLHNKFAMHVIFLVYTPFPTINIGYKASSCDTCQLNVL